MIEHHRKKALMGIALWLLTTAMLIVVCIQSFHHYDNSQRRSDIRLVAGVADLLAMMCFYFWGASNLAKAKGYSGAIALLGILGPIAQLGVIGGLLFMRDKTSRPSMRHRMRRPASSRSSKTEKIVCWRRNALIGNVLGLPGMAAGIFLIVFRIGLFQDHENELILGVFVFLLGYAGVIIGCWWWVKAKGWIDAVVFIGVCPLFMPVVPYVRILFRLNPMIMVFGMIMMPIILMTVVAVLPDKSGWAERKRWRIREQKALDESRQEQTRAE